MKCNIGNDIKLTFASMMQTINKVLPLTSLLANMIEIPEGVHLNGFKHSFQRNQKRRHFFWVTPTVGFIPSTPSNGNSLAWVQDCVLSRYLSNWSTSGSGKRELSYWRQSIVPLKTERLLIPELMV
jgi:hypothetical protein